eukprot:2634201-Pyramimonas_sp.AAC.1
MRVPAVGHILTKPTNVNAPRFDNLRPRLQLLPVDAGQARSFGSSPSGEVSLLIPRSVSGWSSASQRVIYFGVRFDLLQI